MQADIKQEKNHAEFSKLLDGGEITAEARREGTNSDTGQHISYHGWQLQTASKKPTYKCRQECHSNIDQYRKFMLHLLPPSSAEVDPVRVIVHICLIIHLKIKRGNEPS